MPVVRKLVVASKYGGGTTHIVQYYWIEFVGFTEGCIAGAFVSIVTLGN